MTNVSKWPQIQSTRCTMPVQKDRCFRRATVSGANLNKIVNTIKIKEKRKRHEKAAAMHQSSKRLIVARCVEVDEGGRQTKLNGERVLYVEGSRRRTKKT